MNHITFVKTLENGQYQCGYSPVLNPLMADFDNLDYFVSKINAVEGAIRRAKANNAKNCLVVDLSNLEILYACRLRKRSVAERLTNDET